MRALFLVHFMRVHEGAGYQERPLGERGEIISRYISYFVVAKIPEKTT
jgi:hypothetical protein